MFHLLSHFNSVWDTFKVQWPFSLNFSGKAFTDAPNPSVKTNTMRLLQEASETILLLIYMGASYMNVYMSACVWRPEVDTHFFRIGSHWTWGSPTGQASWLFVISPLLGLQVSATVPWPLCKFWVSELTSSCLDGIYFNNWAISSTLMVLLFFIYWFTYLFIVSLMKDFTLHSGWPRTFWVDQITFKLTKICLPLLLVWWD